MRPKSKRLGYELRRKILELVEAGESPLDISRKLYVPVGDVHRAIAWKKHVQAHQRISREYRESSRT